MGARRNPTLQGAALIVAGMVVIGYIDNFVRVIAGEVSVWQFHLMRSAIILILLAAIAATTGQRLRPRRWGPVAVRCAAQAVALVLYFGALPFMPIAQVGAGLFTAPLFVLLFSAMLFGRPIGPRRLLAVALGFAGVLIMLRPDPANLSALVLMPLTAGAFYGLSNLLTREWCADEPVGALLAGFFVALAAAGAAGGAILTLWPVPDAARVAAPFLLRPFAAPSPVVWFWIGVQAVGTLFAVGCITRGYQSGETAILAVFEYSFLITASFWAWVIWDQRLDGLGYLGIALIIVSGAIVARGAASTGPARGPATDAA